MSDAELLHAADQFRRWCEQLQHAARLVFGSHPIASTIEHLCRRRLEEAERLARQADDALLPIVLVGPVGSGKGWLARCFLRDPALRHRIPSGQNAEDRSTRLLWIGPHRPPRLEPGEEFLPASTEQLIDLGVPYLLGDAPGFASSHDAADDLSRRALASAALKLLVFPQERLRDRTLPELIRRLPAARILPVIRFRAAPAQELPPNTLLDDSRHYCLRWQQEAPATDILPPIFIPDADCYAPHDPLQAISAVQNILHHALAPHLSNPATLRRNLAREILARRDLLRNDLRPCLHELRLRLLPTLQDIDRTLLELIPQLAQKIYGHDAQLKMIIRIQMRALWLQATPIWCFPYRSILGLLILTTNAWDRLIFSLLGSLPSLAIAVWQSMKNLYAYGRLRHRQRFDAAALLHQEVREAIAARLLQLRQTLQQFRQQDDQPEHAQKQNLSVRIIGLDEFQNRCRRLLSDAVLDAVARSRAPLAFALLATTAFLLLFSGPVVVIYRQYMETVIRALSGDHLSWHDFPQPSLSMVLTCFIISAIPVAIIAMFALTWATRRSSIEQIASHIRKQMSQLMEQWQTESLLRWEWEEPHVQAVQVLLQAAGSDWPAPCPADSVSPLSPLPQGRRCADQS